MLSWKLLLFNDSIHSFDEVIRALIQIGLQKEEADNKAWEAHLTGNAVVYQGDKLGCERRDSILKTYGLTTKITQ